MTKQAHWVHLLVTGISLSVVSLLFTSALQAQTEPLITSIPAPPPMKFVPAEGRAQLETERDIKRRTQLSIKLAEASLSRSEQLTAAGDLERVTNELGGYQGLVEDALKFLRTFPKGKDKTRDNYKRLELSLRTHIPRLEAIRRATPAAYAQNLRMTIEYVRRAREQALDSFYDDTVLREESGRTEGSKGPAEIKYEGTPR